MTYSCIDSFSGAGGLSLGLMKAGYQLVYSFDNDPRCIETQLANPHYFRSHRVEVADINAVRQGVLLKEIGLARGQLFLLAGGPPCQGFSIQRVGTDEDERNSLVISYVSLVEETMPAYFLMENVPGIMGKRGRTLFDRALSGAAKAGYYIHHQIVDAQDFGVPQRRRRVVVVGERMDCKTPKFVFPQPTTPDGSRVTVRMAIGHLPEPPEDGSDHPSIKHHRRDRLSDTNIRRLMALKPGQGREHLPDELLADCHRIDASVIGHRNVYGRMKWDEVAPTITARFDSFTRGQFGHPEQLRSISLREGALIQTFPEDFVFSGSKVEIARQIGNAVPPTLAEIIGRQIIKCYEGKAS